MRSFLFIGVLLAILFLSSCKTTNPAIYAEPVIGSTDFDYWIHSPLHPESQQPVEIKASINDVNGIQKVELSILEYELYTNSLGNPSKRRKTGNQWGIVKTWEYEKPIHEIELTYIFELGFHDFSNVEYHFKVYDVNGATTTKMAQFDAGTSPWGDEKILLYSTSRNPMKSTINLCFLPDTDYNQNWGEFLTEVEGLIYDGYHKNNKIKEDKELWQFFYTKHEIDGKAIADDYHNNDLYPSFLKNALIQGIDAFGLLHKTPYGDGAYLQKNLHFLSYNLFTSEAYNYGTAIHETAHAIFNLSDEYDQCVCFENSKGANVFGALKSCQFFNKENGFPTSDCSPIQHLNGKNWFMSEKNVYFKTRDECEAFNENNGYDKGSCERFIDVNDQNWFRSLEGLCIMQDDGDGEVRDFKRTCSSIIDKYYEQIREKSTKRLTIQEELQDNIFGYESVIIMELHTHNADISFNSTGIRQGVPKKNYITQADLNIDFYDAAGVKQHSVPLANPSELFIHGSEGGVVRMSDMTYRFTVPYEYGMETLRYRFKDRNDTQHLKTISKQ